jgi:hypothetical protein
MPPRADTDQEPRLPPLAWTVLIGAGLLLVLLVVGIGIQIAILKDSREHIAAQDAKLALVVSKVREAEPTARAAAPLIRQAAPLVRKVSRAIGPLTRSGGSLATATENLPRLIRTTQALAAVALPALSDVRRANLVGALEATNQMLAQVRAEDLIGVTARAARRTPRLMRRLLRIQLITLTTQKRSLETQLETLDIQRQALVHIESIDRKTGGPAPAPTAPVP